jgi:hypothetical protein
MIKSPLAILILIVIVGTSAGLVIKFNQDWQSAKGQLDNERYSRMLAEEGLEKAKSDLASADSELSRIKNKLSILEKSLEQTRVVNDDLKSRLDQAADIKKNLEAKIQELNDISQQPIIPMFPEPAAEVQAVVTEPAI